MDLKTAPHIPCDVGFAFLLPPRYACAIQRDYLARRQTDEFLNSHQDLLF